MSEQRDLNPRPTAPKAAALAKLRYAPILFRREQNISILLNFDQEKFTFSRLIGWPLLLQHIP